MRSTTFKFTSYRVDRKQFMISVTIMGVVCEGFFLYIRARIPKEAGLPSLCCTTVRNRCKEKNSGCINSPNTARTCPWNNMGLFVAGSLPCNEHSFPSLTSKGSAMMIFDELCTSIPHDPQSTTTYFGIFGNCYSTEDGWTGWNAKDDHESKARGEMNVTPWSPQTTLPTFALIVLVSWKLRLTSKSEINITYWDRSTSKDVWNSSWACFAIAGSDECQLVLFNCAERITLS